jgi:hypothetical protein
VPGTLSCDGNKTCVQRTICVVAISQSVLDTVTRDDFCPLIRGGGDGTSIAWGASDDSVNACDGFLATAVPRLCAGRPSGTMFLQPHWDYDAQGKYLGQYDPGPGACP